MRVLKPLVVVIAITLFPFSVRAGQIFNNLEAQGGPEVITGTVGPVGSLTFGVELFFDRDVRITEFELYNSIGMDGLFRFVIYDQPGTNPLYQGDPLSFAKDDSPTFKSSGPLDFTFRSGTTYALGAISSVGMAMPYTESGPMTIGGITATGRNPNFMGVISGPAPRYVGSAEVQGFVRLHDDSPSNEPTLATPEPSTIALAASALPIGLIAWRRRRKAATA